MAEIGERKNTGKLRWRNFPLFLVEPLVAVGAAAEKHSGNPDGKYETFNFLKGMKVNDCLDCAKRHLMKAESPYHGDMDEEFAEEKQVFHLAECAWNCLVALHNIKTRPDLDDRYKTQLKKQEEQLAPETAHRPSRPEKPFQIGDLIKTANSDATVEVAGFFYDDNDQLVLFIQDDNGRIYQADYRLYVRA